MSTREETIHASLDRMLSRSFQIKNSHLKARLDDVHDAIALVKKEFGRIEAKKKSGGLSPEDEADYDRYADKLADGLPKIENGVVDLMQAFISGDSWAEAESVLNLCGSLVATVGAMVGPLGALVGGLLGAALGLISAILKLFGPPPIPLIDQIKTLLEQEEAKAQYQQLRVALVGFQSLEDAWEVGLWPDANLQNGPEVQQLRAADEWLIEPDNQAPVLWDKWGKVLDMQCKVFIAAVKTVPIALHALDQQTGMSAYEKQNAGGLLTIGIRTLARNQLAFLESVAPVVQRQGIYWMLGTNQKVYFSEDQFAHVNEDDNDRYHLSVTATMDELQKSNPNLQVFGLDVSGQTYHSTMQWPSGSLNWSALIPGLCHDVCAIGDDKGQTFYWLAFPGLVSCVSLETNQEVNHFTIDGSFKVKSVRAVFGPRSIGDDPDENTANPRVLDGVTQAVYVGIENSKSIYVHAATAGDPKDGVISTPEGMDSYYGIGVDRRFLWVFGQQNIYRASHTSVLRSLGKTPSWTSVLPGADDNYLTGAVCEDHSLFLRSTSDNTLSFVSYDTKYWNNDGLFSLGDNPNTSLQVLKLPSYRWFSMGGLMESLRVQAKKPTKAVSKLAASI
jgi:hypothetical protein